MDKDRPGRPPSQGRARKRAIRAHAAIAGIPYSVAARQIESASLHPGETLASSGRTVYPIALDSDQRWSLDRRERRPPDHKAWDTLRAAVIPSGRAQHLADRFPPTPGPTGSGAGPLYDGPGRRHTLAIVYLVIAHETPDVIPAIGELARTAESGEETALDVVCAALDRTARRLLDGDLGNLRQRAQAALSAAEQGKDRAPGPEAARLSSRYRLTPTPREPRSGGPVPVGPPVEGARQTLDALLVIADDGHAPGTRVRLLTPDHRGETSTIISLAWAAWGPPIGYTVCPDGTPAALRAAPDELVVLADQEVGRSGNWLSGWPYSMKPYSTKTEPISR
jgi:hypothetical protein